MRFLDLTLPTLAENLALDEAILLDAESKGGEVLRIWEWATPAVVLGAGCNLAEDVDEFACQADDVPILRRSSGGGTVLLGPGCLCFSLVLRYDRHPALAAIRSSYAYILGQVGRALADVVPGIEHAGISDFAVNGLKVSGNAQQRKRRHLLHHGTMLYAFDARTVGRYLRMPRRRPDYRRDRSHAAFLGTLPINATSLRRRLQEAFQADCMDGPWPADRVRALVREKYLTPEWTQRR